MKKALLLLAVSAFATVSFAQTTPSTETKVRDNGTTKTVAKTGKTNVGQALENTGDAAGNVAKKGVNGVKKGFHKGKHTAKSGTQKVGKKLDKSTAKMEAKSE